MTSTDFAEIQLEKLRLDTNNLLRLGEILVGPVETEFQGRLDSDKIEGLVNASLGSTKLIEHEILHYPSLPLARNFVLDTAVIVVILAR